MNLLRFLLAVAPPVALLAGALALIARPSLVPPSLTPLIPQLPYVAAAGAIVLGLVFHRGRVVFTAIALAIGYAAMQAFPDDAASARAAFAGLCFLAPPVIVTIAWLEERRTWNTHSVARIALIVGSIVLSLWLAEHADALRRLYVPLTPAGLATPIPQLGLVVIGVSISAAIAAAAVRRSVVIAGLAWALVALAVALHTSTRPASFAIAMTSALLVLAQAVLQDTYRMAFRDELTGLPGRRALNEALQVVGRRYAIGIVDVDHFKKLNDTYGHDVGDQVLRMIATRLARVSGGGRAFRYGGEEFGVLFMGKTTDAATPHMEALRTDIEHYQMAIRSSSRPKRTRAGKLRRGGDTTLTRTLAVTVSIGIAGRSGRMEAPKAVLRAADRALYRAKRTGRNRVCV